jgi:hypothetical protein
VAQLSANAAEQLAPAQAAELTRIIDLEARWENMRVDRPGPGHDTLDLQNRQRTYEAFRARRAAYVAQYRTDRIPELTPNGPDRLAAWCRAVRSVLRRAEPGTECPAHAIEKAYRLTDRLAARLNEAPVVRGTPDGIAAAIRELDGIIRWCDGLLGGPDRPPDPAFEVGKGPGPLN